MRVLMKNKMEVHSTKNETYIVLICKENERYNYKEICSGTLGELPVLR